MRIYAKSAHYGRYKEPLAEHTIKGIQAGRQSVRNLPTINQYFSTEINNDINGNNQYVRKI